MQRVGAGTERVTFNTASIVRVEDSSFSFLTTRFCNRNDALLALCISISSHCSTRVWELGISAVVVGEKRAVGKGT